MKLFIITALIATTSAFTVNGPSRAFSSQRFSDAAGKSGRLVAKPVVIC